MVNRLSFYKPTRPKLLQIGQTRYQSTPLYLYIQNIKLVCDSGTLCAALEWENLLYTQPNINSMVNLFSFFKPTRPKLLQIGQTRYNQLHSASTFRILNRPPRASQDLHCGEHGFVGPSPHLNRPVRAHQHSRVLKTAFSNFLDTEMCW